MKSEKVEQAFSFLWEGIRPLFGPFLVCLFGIPGLIPLLNRTLTRSTDGILHLYRLVELDACIRKGLLFPR
jgi:hypothetical protein